MSAPTVYVLELNGGYMVYNCMHDEWELYSNEKPTDESIDANHFGTIREFKQWGQEKLDG